MRDKNSDPVACLREVRGKMKDSLEIVRRWTSSVITFAGGMDKQRMTA